MLPVGECAAAGRFGHSRLVAARCGSTNEHSLVVDLVRRGSLRQYELALASSRFSTSRLALQLFRVLLQRCNCFCCLVLCVSGVSACVFVMVWFVRCDCLSALYRYCLMLLVIIA